MFFDTHAHLDQSDFDPDRADVILRARQAGVTQILCAAVSAASAEAVLRLADEYDLPAAVGIHPNYAAEAAADDWQRITDLVAHPRVVALGETGLDRYRDHAPFALQQELFEKHLTLAREKNLPVLIHCRDAAADLLPMLAVRAPLRGVIHAFSGDAALAAKYVELGLHVSFADNVTYSNKKFDSLRAAAKTIPDDRLLIETDSPYLVPQAFRGRVKRNEPANVIHAAAFLAELRASSTEKIAALTTANARRLFGLVNNP